MKKYQYDIKVTINAEQLEDLLEQAIRGAYEVTWLDEADPQDKKISEGGKYVIHDAEEDQEHDVYATTLLKGLSLYKRANFEDFDMYDAQAVLQLGLFGRLIYA